MNMDEIKHFAFDHTKPIGGMGGEEVLREFLYLTSGHADELDPQKHVRLGLPPLLKARKKELEQHLIACVNYHQIPTTLR